MKNSRLYRKSKQKGGAKRMEFLLDVRCVQILTTQSRNPKYL